MHRTTRRLLLLPVALSAMAVGSCNWVSLAKNALTYRETERGEAANVATRDTLIYATQAEDGLAILAAGSGSKVGALPPPAGSESIDDLATAPGCKAGACWC